MMFKGVLTIEDTYTGSAKVTMETTTEVNNSDETQRSEAAEWFTKLALWVQEQMRKESTE